MRRIAAASLALFLTLPIVATAQVRGMSITPGQHMQMGIAAGAARTTVGTAAGSVHATVGIGPATHGPVSIGPSVGVFHPPFRPFRPHYPRSVFYPYWGSYYYGYSPYYAYSPYYGYYDYDTGPPYTGYIGGTFDSASPYAGYGYPPQYPAPAGDDYASSAPPPASYAPPSGTSQQQAQPSQSNANRSQGSSAGNEFVQPTVLVFRDGHRQEVANYAIMGSTIFLFSGPRARIPIAELDVPATVQVNQDRGVDFRVPQKAQ